MISTFGVNADLKLSDNFHCAHVESACMTPWSDGVEAIATSTHGTCIELGTSTVVSMVVQILQLRACGVLT